MSVDLETRLRDQLPELADAIVDRRVRGFEPRVRPSRRGPGVLAVGVVVVAALVAGVLTISSPEHQSAVTAPSVSRKLIATLQQRFGDQAAASDLVVISPRSGDVVQRIENIGLRSVLVAHDRTAYATSLSTIRTCDDGTPITNSEISAIDLTTGGRTPVATGVAPSLSPDGTRLAYTQFTCDGYSVTAQDLVGGTARSLWYSPPTAGAIETPIAWSRDGQRLLLRVAEPTVVGSRFPNDQIDIWEPNGQSFDSVRRVPMLGRDEGPYDLIQAPDGRWIAAVGPKDPWHPIELVEYDLHRGKVTRTLLKRVPVEGQKKNPSYTIDLLDVDADGRILFAVVPSGNVYQWTPGDKSAVLVAPRGGSAAWISP